jgi:shikimate kinase
VREKVFFRKAPFVRRKLDKPILIVGLMGVGKTSIGKSLARALGLAFDDTDSLIELSSGGLSIVEIFSLYGEDVYRQKEEKFLQGFLGDVEKQVVSTGEGGFLYDSIRKLAKEKFITIWLKGDLNVLVDRTSRRDTRPLLLNENIEEVLSKLEKERYSLYKEADIHIDVDGFSKQKTVKKILSELDSFLG